VQGEGECGHGRGVRRRAPADTLLIDQAPAGLREVKLPGRPLCPPRCTACQQGEEQADAGSRRRRLHHQGLHKQHHSYHAV